MSHNARNVRTRLALSIALAAVLVESSGASATDRFVSPAGSDTANDCSVAATPCATIVGAVDQAASGDVIKLSGGIWSQPVLIDTSIALAFEGGYSADFTGRDLALYPSIINLLGQYNVLGILMLVPVGGTIDVAIDGLIFQDCDRGGIDALLQDSAGTVSLDVSNVLVERCGWGLRQWFDASVNSSLSVRDSEFRSNGSGITLHADTGAVGEVTIERVKLYRNTHSALDSEIGGVVVIRDSLIYANRTTYGGGALIVGNSSPLDLSIHNVTVAKTKARKLYPSGGYTGMLIYGCETVVDIRNTIVWETRPSDQSLNVYLGCADIVATATFNSFDTETWTNRPENFSASNNFIGKPYLRKGGHLRRSSPLFDAGTCVGVSSTDFEGDARPTGAGCDIGADEIAP